MGLSPQFRICISCSNNYKRFCYQGWCAAIRKSWIFFSPFLCTCSVSSSQRALHTTPDVVTRACQTQRGTLQTSWNFCIYSNNFTPWLFTKQLQPSMWFRFRSFCLGKQWHVTHLLFFYSFIFSFVSFRANSVNVWINLKVGCSWKTSGWKNAGGIVWFIVHWFHSGAAK